MFHATCSLATSINCFSSFAYYVFAVIPYTYILYCVVCKYVNKIIVIVIVMIIILLIIVIIIIK